MSSDKRCEKCNRRSIIGFGIALPDEPHAVRVVWLCSEHFGERLLQIASIHRLLHGMFKEYL
jgi:hypothetical protein